MCCLYHYCQHLMVQIRFWCHPTYKNILKKFSSIKKLAFPMYKNIIAQILPYYLYRYFWIVFAIDTAILFIQVDPIGIKIFTFRKTYFIFRIWMWTLLVVSMMKKLYMPERIVWFVLLIYIICVLILIYMQLWNIMF